MGSTRKVSDRVAAMSHRGLVITIKSYWNRLRERVEERRLGIRSAEIISLKEIGLEHEDRRGYWPVTFRDFKAMLKFLRPTTPDEVFVDYGAGLGRAVVLAAMLPFKHVIGIEISSALAERARENVSRCRRKLRCRRVEILAVDAAEFEVPTDASTIFFNNPFAGEILVKVLHNIRLSYERRQRRLRLICYLPAESAFQDQICRSRGLEVQHQIQLAEGRKCLVIAVR
jgi:SAM-dependent methyltransferase